MSKLSYFSLLFMIIFLAGCRKDDDPILPKQKDLKVQFVAEYDGKPLIFNSLLNYEFNTYLKLSRLDYFISDLALMSSKDTILLRDIGYLDFTKTNRDEATAANGVVWTIKDVPVGDYNALRMGIGVNPKLNATKPADYPSTHPLSNLELYWAGWNSYIFSRMEGKIDTLSTGLFATGFTYHTGMNNVYREVNLQSAMKIDPTVENNTITIHLDVKKLFSSPEGWLDILEIQEAHGPGDMATVLKIVNNYATAFSIKK